MADGHGYFVKNASNQTFLSDLGEFLYGTIDLTNPAAFSWYKNGAWLTAVHLSSCSGSLKYLVVSFWSNVLLE